MDDQCPTCKSPKVTSSNHTIDRHSFIQITYRCGSVLHKDNIGGIWFSEFKVKCPVKK